MEKFKLPPLNHQLECLNRFGRSEYFALLAEQGTGKTYIIINNIADLWSSRELDAAIVFAPNGVHTNWTRRELPKTMPDWVRYRAAAWQASMGKKEKAAFDSLLGSSDSTELRILTMNWEALATKRGKEVAERFCNSASKLMIVCDESHRVKNPSTVTYKALDKLKKQSNWRRIMSGTSIANAPFDAWSQFMFLDEDILGCSSYYAFKSEYAEMIPAHSKMLQGIMRKHGMARAPQIVQRDNTGKPKYRNLEKLNKLIAPHSFRVLKKDCLDLPDKVYKTAYFDLTIEQRRIYNKALEEGRLSLEGEDTPFTRLVVLGKLAQITSGYYLHPDSEEPVRIDGGTPKLALLLDRVSAALEEERKVIIWARYHVEIDDICTALSADGLEPGADFVQYHGGIKKADREVAIDTFENGTARVFVGQQQAGGVGITLIAASEVIYFSNTFSLVDREQSEDRAHRIGQTKTVVYTNLVASETIDEQIVDALQSKKTMAEIILAFPKK